MKTVFVNGCFDPLHGGHVIFLRRARELGDRLVVAINDDDSIYRIKGTGRPRVPLMQRIIALRELRCVDEVLWYSEDTADEILQRVRPQIVAKGREYSEVTTVELDTINAIGAQVAFLEMLPSISSTIVFSQIHNSPSKRVNLITDLALDRYWLASCSGISKEFPLTVGRLDSIEYFPGGGAGLSVSLQRLNALNAMYGVIGSENEDELLLNLLKAESIGLDNLCILPGAWCHTFGKVVQEVHGGSRYEITRLDARPKRKDLTVARQSLAKQLRTITPMPNDVVVISRYESPEDSALDDFTLRELPDSIGNRVFLVGACRTNPLSLRKCDAIVINEAECLLCLGFSGELRQISEEDVRSVAALSDSKHLVVTCGNRGAFHWERATNNVREFSTLACPPGTDPTGAGDVFLAAFSASLCSNLCVETAVRRAVATATASLFSQRRPAIAATRFVQEYFDV